MIPPDILSPEWLSGISPFVKAGVGGALAAIGVIIGWVRDFRKTAHDDDQDDEDREELRRGRAEIAAENKRVNAELSAENKALKEQHAFDNMSLRAYEMHMIICHREIEFLRRKIVRLCKDHGEKEPEFEQLPPLPQPTIKP